MPCSPLSPLGPVSPLGPAGPATPGSPLSPLGPTTPASPVVFFAFEPTKIKSPLESLRFSAYKPSPKSIRKPLARKFSTTVLPIAGDVVAPAGAFAPPL